MNDRIDFSRPLSSNLPQTYFQSDVTPRTIFGRRTRYNHKVHRAPVVEEAIDFNPEWLNEQGLMVNVPAYSSYLAGIDFKRPESNRAIGVYIVDKAADPLSGMTTTAPQQKGDAILRFSISANAIHQELTRGRLALIDREGSVRIMDERKQLIERWEPYVTLKNPLQPSLGFTKTWRRVMHVGPQIAKPEVTQIPATYGKFFEELTGMIQRFVKKLGYAEALEKDLEEGEEDPFYWLFRLAQEDSDARYSMEPEHTDIPPLWVHLDVDHDAYLLWVELYQWTHTKLTIGASLNPRHHAQIFQDLRAYIDRAIAIRNTAWQRHASTWQTRPYGSER
jgi:hypothetical protein